MIRKTFVGFFIMVVLAGLGGCGTNLMKFYFEDLFESGSKEEASPDQLMWKGIESFRRKKYGGAQKAFQKIVEQYPYSRHVILAELKLADAYYLDKKYQEAVVAYEKFARLHPAHEAVPYVLYQIGMSYFQLGKDTRRDHEQLKKALSVFERLARAYPGTIYAQKAQEQAKVCKKKLAEHELDVATFYYKRGKYGAAKNRIEYALANYLEELAETKQLQKAEEMLKKCSNKISEGAEKPSIWVRLGF